MTKRELDKIGCRTFVCPYLGSIDEDCKRLDLSDRVAKRARNIAVDYLKKTYHNPLYTGVRPVFAGAICIASILEGEYITPYGMRCRIKYAGSVPKWVRIIVKEVCLEIEFADNNGKLIRFKYGDEIKTVSFNGNKDKVDAYRSIYSLNILKSEKKE